MDYETPPSFEPPTEPPTPRRGGARDRKRRRELERQGMAPPSGFRGSLPQLSPAGGMKMPPIPLPQLRYGVYVAGAVVLVLGIMYMLSQLTGAKPPVTPPNALWLGTEWTYALDEERSMPELVARLRENRIGTVYAWVSWLKDDMTWGGRRDMTNNFLEVEVSVKTFVRDFKALYPEAKLYAWIGLPVGGQHDELRPMSSPDVQEAMAAFSERTINEFGFDGVFLNIETVWNNDTDYLAVLGKVRERLGADAFISTAIPPDWSPLNAGIPVPPLIEPGTAWDERYKQSVALLVDELALMAYNSGLSSSADYIQWMAYQVKTYANAVAALDTGTGAGTRIMVGIPTYDAELPGHDPLVENVPSAMQGLRLGLEQAGENARYVHGTAIYADWETDETEWAQFTMNLDGAPPG